MSLFFREVAHRGMKNRENTISGIIKANSILDIVEIDVRFNTDRQVILCHDRDIRNDVRNETLLELLSSNDNTESLRLMIDIKAFGIESAKYIAECLHTLAMSFPRHSYFLCSFNEFCVDRLLDLRKAYNAKYSVGIISSGIPLNLFDSLQGIDFVSIEYSVICESIVDIFRKKNILVFTWTVNTPDMKHYALHTCRVDGIIFDIYDE